MVVNSIYKLHAEDCKTLGNSHRIQIIDPLQHKELCFSDIPEVAEALKSNLSQHLPVITKKAILQMKRDGQFNYYPLSSKKVFQACRLMREVLMNSLKKHKDLPEKM